MATSTETSPQTARQMEAQLLSLLQLLSDEPDLAFETETQFMRDATVNTFADVGLLTNSRGVVVRLADGSEFQLTVTAC